MDRSPVVGSMLRIALFIVAIVMVALPASYFLFNHTFVLSIMVIVVGVASFYGFLMLPGSCDAEGIFDERRIRLAITASLFLMYVAYFGTAVFWKEGDAMGDLEKELFKSITTLLGIVLPFYFGASVASDYLKGSTRKKKDGPSEED